MGPNPVATHRSAPITPISGGTPKSIPGTPAPDAVGFAAVVFDGSLVHRAELNLRSVDGRKPS
jgi:hypothetical protein